MDYEITVTINDPRTGQSRQRKFLVKNYGQLNSRMKQWLDATKDYLDAYADGEDTEVV
jgi:hypothetical protein